jgi:hypothetical protein
MIGKRERRLAERVGFAPMLPVESKELNHFPDQYDPLNALNRPRRDTY